MHHFISVVIPHVRFLFMTVSLKKCFPDITQLLCVNGCGCLYFLYITIILSIQFNIDLFFPLKNCCKCFVIWMLYITLEGLFTWQMVRLQTCRLHSNILIHQTSITWSILTPIYLYMIIFTDCAGRFRPKPSGQGTRPQVCSLWFLQSQDRLGPCQEHYQHVTEAVDPCTRVLDFLGRLCSTDSYDLRNSWNKRYKFFCC